MLHSWVLVYSSFREVFRFPIKHTSEPHDFGFVIEKVRSRLAGWKSHLLSFVGRLVLTQVVTAVILSYTMQYAILPP